MGIMVLTENPPDLAKVGLITPASVSLFFYQQLLLYLIGDLT